MISSRIVAALSLLLLGHSIAKADTAVTVEINGVENHEGSIVVRLYDNKKSWLKDAAHETSLELDQDCTSAVVVIPMTVPPGDYAVHVYHDLDANGKMKTNFIGIPKEPTGVSNDAKGKMGPPKFKDAVLSVGTEPTTIPINLTKI